MPMVFFLKFTQIQGKTNDFLSGMDEIKEELFCYIRSVTTAVKSNELLRNYPSTCLFEEQNLLYKVSIFLVVESLFNLIFLNSQKYIHCQLHLKESRIVSILTCLFFLERS